MFHVKRKRKLMYEKRKMMRDVKRIVAKKIDARTCVIHCACYYTSDKPCCHCGTC